MNEFIEKLIGRLEESKKVLEEEALKELTINGHTLDFENYNGGAGAVKCIITLVKHLAEEHNGGWIPCSEKLPEANGKYLVCVSNPTRVRKNCIFTFWYNEYDKEFIREHDLDYVIAWQPLPDPYIEKC